MAAADSTANAVAAAAAATVPAAPDADGDGKFSSEYGIDGSSWPSGSIPTTDTTSSGVCERGSRSWLSQAVDDLWVEDRTPAAGERKPPRPKDRPAKIEEAPRSKNRPAAGEREPTRSKEGPARGDQSS